MNKLFVHGILKGRKGARKAQLYGYKQFMRGFSTFTVDLDSVIYGELIEVDDETLAEFDIVEGVANNYYHRFLTQVITEDNEICDAWVYQQVEDKI